VSTTNHEFWSLDVRSFERIRLTTPLLVVCLLGLAVAALHARGAQEEQQQEEESDEAPALFFYADKEMFELTHDPALVAVRTGNQSAGTALEELQSVLPALEELEGLGEWTLFALPSASSTEGAATGEGILEHIAALASELGEKYFFSPVFGSEASRSVVNGKIIVRFEEDEVQPFAEKVLVDAGVEIKEQHFAGMHNVYRGTLPGARSGLEVLEVSNALALLDFVRWSEPSFTQFFGASSCVPLNPPPTGSELTRSGSFLGPYDPGSGSYGVNAIAAWDLCGGSDGSGPAITVGIAGDGVEKIHPDLDANVWLPPPGTVADFASNSACPGPTQDGTPQLNCDWHETGVAGVIGMISGTSFGVGAAPEVRLATSRAACHMQGFSPFCFARVDIDDFADALEYLALRPAVLGGPEARVVNMSWNSFAESTCVRDKVQDLFDAGVVVVNSSGNFALTESDIRFPGRTAKALAVGAIDPTTGLRWPSSNHGPDLDFVAPGVGIYSTDRMGENGLDRADNNWSGGRYPAGDSNDGDFTFDGTSFAAPFVSAAAALLLAEHPSFTPDDVYAVLCASAHDLGTPGKDDEYGCGLIDIRAALDLAADPDAFDDGFDAGTTSGWSGVKSPALLDVTPAAAFAGAFGLRIDAIPCTVPENVTVPDGVVNTAEVYEACSSISAGNVDVVNPGSLELRASELVTLGAGFSVGANASFEATINPTLAGKAYVEDDTPDAERLLRLRFYARLDQLTLGSGDAFDHLQARGPGGVAHLRLILRGGSGANSLEVSGREDSGAEVSTSPVVVPSSGWIRVEVEWKAADPGRSDGHVRLWIDGVEQPGLTDLDNELGAIDQLRWGVVEGLDAGTSGTLDLDELVWRRVGLPIGP
jgi:subtilisin family serine protease